MPRFIVRTNCEYSLAVDVENADEAITKAAAVDLENWDQAWAPMEAEEE